MLSQIRRRQMSDTQSSSGDQLFAARNWCACVYVCVCVRVCVCVCTLHSKEKCQLCWPLDAKTCRHPMQLWCSANYTGAHVCSHEYSCTTGILPCRPICDSHCWGRRELYLSCWCDLRKVHRAGICSLFEKRLLFKLLVSGCSFMKKHQGHI